MCIILLMLGYLGTLGVGTFGIRVRGEDGFSYQFVAETMLPVVPSFDKPFPQGLLPIRVKIADNADCSNILRAERPTVYGCDLLKLTGNTTFVSEHSAAVDAGSLRWIMKRKIGDILHYPHGDITIERTMKASVFQHGMLIDQKSFRHLFPEVQGAQFFLIREQKDVEFCRKYLQPYGVKILSVDEFMAVAEYFQNCYLSVFLQLSSLGFVLGMASLMLLLVRNLYARREEFRFLETIGFSRKDCFHVFLTENILFYMVSAIVSLGILGMLVLFFRLSILALLIGWTGLTLVGIGTIFGTLWYHFYRSSELGCYGVSSSDSLRSRNS